MKDYNSKIYDEQRVLIRRYRERNVDWSSIKYGKGGNLEDLQAFLNRKSEDYFWEITVEDWLELVRLEEEGEKRRQDISCAEKSSIIGGRDDINGVTIPIDPHSC